MIEPDLPGIKIAHSSFCKLCQKFTDKYVSELLVQFSQKWQLTNMLCSCFELNTILHSLYTFLYGKSVGQGCYYQGNVRPWPCAYAGCLQFLEILKIYWNLTSSGKYWKSPEI